jgi:hypothetical protein
LQLNILILGTSNSILKGGWVTGLRHTLPEAVIKNMSIGASPGIQFGVHASIDFSEYQFVFFDSIPNDEQFLYGTIGGSRLSFSNRVLFEIFQTISLQTNLIILGFCLERFLTDPSGQFSSVVWLAALSSGQFVDVRRLLSTFGASILGHSSLYGDGPTHPQTDFAFEVGAAIGFELDQFRTPPKASGLKNWAGNFSTWVPDETWQHFPRHKLSTSLLAETFSKLSAGDRFSLFPDRRCIGFYINMRGTSCDLLMEADKHIRLYYRLEKDKVIKVFVPIPNGSSLVDMRVSLSSGRPTFLPIGSSWSRQDDDQVCFSVSQFLFWEGQDNEEPLADVESHTQEEALQFNHLVFQRISNLVEEGYFAERRNSGLVDI